jgi:F-type H+-transporting ATPase subunit b
MRIDWWTLGLQAVNLLVLVWILARFLFRPVSAMIAARQAATAKLLDEARAARAAADAERLRASDETTRLAKAREELLQAANAEAEAEKAALLAEARTQVEQLLAAANAEIARARQQEASAADERASRLAIAIASKVMTRLPDELRVAGFVEGLATGLAALPDATRAEIGADGAPLHLKAARFLTNAEAETCRAALARALGRPVEIAVETDPGLIAGLELDTRHAVVRNSLRADLDRLSVELMRHDEPR